jgi:hypothetical protein
VIVFGVGSLYDGINRYVTFGWMFHQAQEAQGQGSLWNFLSYPFYTFVLEGIFFAIIFWANIYLVFQKQWSKLLPFGLVVLQMILFSFAAEKGARYLCVLLPFMAIAAALCADYFINLKVKKFLISFFILFACYVMSTMSMKIIFSSTQYDAAVNFILKHDPKAGILSTQPLVEQLYVQDEKAIRECPKNLADMINLYKQGFRYLIIDPQVYISWTKDTQRFSPPLIDFLEMIREKVPPLKSFNHLNAVLMNRFVLDHNQNLLQSISFLSESNKAEYGQIRVYDIGQCLLTLKKQALERN